MMARTTTICGAIFIFLLCVFGCGQKPEERKNLSSGEQIGDGLTPAFAKWQIRIYQCGGTICDCTAV
ncbi:MAG: hypothetical protein ACR2HG_10170 [Pyrinomonadaceae bacterium]